MAFNIFRILADLSHLLSILILLHKMVQLQVRLCPAPAQSGHSLILNRAAPASASSRKPCISWSISLDISVCWSSAINWTHTYREPDLFWTASRYNIIFKILFIAAQGYIIYLMTTAYKPTNDPNIDTFRVQYLLGGAAVLAILFPYYYTFMEILWAFSIWLEAVAILPQLFMLQRTGEAETITTHYLFALGIYRALYIPNWIYRYVTEGESHKTDWIAIIAGIIQTILYSDFFWIYYTKVMKGKKFKLPV
jgi:ER lumen protein retaining receptor